MNSRRSVLLGAAGALVACAGRPDLVSFDRGEFALTYAKLMTFGQTLLMSAITKNTKVGVANAYAQSLQKFLDDLTRIDDKITKAIIEAPQKSKDSQDAGLAEIASILTKATPFILPLLATL